MTQIVVTMHLTDEEIKYLQTVCIGLGHRLLDQEPDLSDEVIQLCALNKMIDYLTRVREAIVKRTGHDIYFEFEPDTLQ